MNPVKLKFRHGGEMLVSPIGLRFVEDPDHGPLVLIPEVSQPRGYQLDMTLDQARQAFSVATLAAQIPAPGEITRLEEQLEALARRYSRYESLDAEFLAGNAARWQALAIHLGLPEGWEHLHEEAAEVKGALVSQAEMLDSVKAHVDALYSELGLNSRWEGEKLVSYRDTDSILTEVVLMQREVSRLTEEASLFTVVERVEELEESQKLLHERMNRAAELREDLRQRTEKLETVSVSSLLADNARIRRWQLDDSLKTGEALRRIERLESWKNEIHPDLAEDRAFPLLDDRTCVQRSTWTVPQSVDRTETGRIEDEVNRLHGELDARVSDLENRMDEEQSKIRTPWIGPDTVRLVLPEPEKPKSAWRPAAECDRAGWYLLRVPGYGYTARPCYYRNFWDRSDLERAGFKNGIACLEFCPIPE